MLNPMAKILVAEDDRDMQYILHHVLNDAGYSVEVVNEGTKIVNEQVEVPDLFILDQQMPTIDGLALTKYLKINNRTKNVPIIMISAYPESRKRAKKIGVNDFLEKPFQSENLLKIIKRYVSRV
jgi:CheY-like chemotaxis protein